MIPTWAKWALYVLFLVIFSLFAEAFADARPGQYCTSTKVCGSLELCVTADPWASAGTCQKLKLLP